MKQPNNNYYGKIPPQDLELEMIVLGSLILESDSYYKVVNLITEESFYNPVHQTIFKAVKTLHDNSKPVDLITVTGYLKSINKLEEVGGPLFITQLISRIGSAAHIEHHSRIIAELAIRRQIIRISSDIQQNVYDTSIDINEALNELKSGIFSIDNLLVISETGKTQDQTIKEAIAKTEESYKLFALGKRSGIPTGLAALNNATSGWQKTNLIILAARPSIGKTSLALHFAKIAAKAGTWVNFYGLEMGSEDLQQINISGESNISRSKIRDGDLSPDDWDKINQASTHLLNLPILWYDSVNITASIINANTRKNIRRGKCGMIIIDYLQLLNPTDKKAIREQQIAEITRSLKKTALEMKVPIILLSQLNREASQGKPQLHHLRESGAIEQDADIVIFPYREDEKFSLIIAKNRRGITGEFRITVNDELTRFGDFSNSPEMPTRPANNFYETDNSPF